MNMSLILFFDACCNGEIDVIDRLIDRFPINAINGVNNALITVCRTKLPNAIDIARILIARGIDVDYCNKYGTNALDILLFREVFDRQLATLVLYNSKLGVNHLGNHGYNYLIQCETLESVVFLVENGININQTYASGSNPITFMDMILEDKPEDKSEEDSKIVQYLASVGGKRYQDL